MITPALQAEIEREMKVNITSIAPLSAANYAQIYRMTCSGGEVFVAKVAERGLDSEAFMLKYLRQNTKLPVPQVYFCNEHVIIMEFIESHHVLDAQSQRHAAELLAALHGIQGKLYGFERDMLVGLLRQPNTQSPDWVGFFTQHRLLYMAAEALKEQKIDAKTMKQCEKLAGKLKKYITQPAPPSLSHGDVWSGNFLAGRGVILAFLDPAIYYADPEVELATIHAFKTFDENFFARYNEIRPIRPGFFEERADIYALYPLLVHARLFGLSYARRVQRILDRFV